MQLRTEIEHRRSMSGSQDQNLKFNDEQDEDEETHSNRNLWSEQNTGKRAQEGQLQDDAIKRSRISLDVNAQYYFGGEDFFQVSK